MSQLPLGIAPPMVASFQTFFISPKNAPLCAALRTDATPLEPLIVIYGASGVGCSHLLQATCAQNPQQSCYISLQRFTQNPLQIFTDIESFDLVCMDDIDSIAGHPMGEEALFFAFNRIRDAGKRLIMASHSAPNHLPIGLKDLQSRLHWGLVMTVHDLDDDEKVQALCQRAHTLGLYLSEEASQYIMDRSGRNMKVLCAVLERLDAASLSAQRKLTIPFIKQVLHW